jgi:sensor histidine kinase regulating citrate/malate metabolism
MFREKAHHEAWIEDRAKALAQAVHVSPHTARQVKDRFKKNVRQHAAEVVQYAIEHDWVVYRTEGQARVLHPGESRPS